MADPTLPAGYSFGDSLGYTKKYADPWQTSFEYVDANGNVVGKGYDSYQDAIRKMAFNAGKKFLDPVPEQYPSAVYDGSGESGMGMTAGSPALPAGWTYGFPQYDTGGGNMAGGYSSPRFATEQELYDYLLKQPGSPISYDSYEKYGRKLNEGQMQNMYALLSHPNGKLALEAYGGVPDWDYHRAAYEAAYNPVAGMQVSGEKALIGSRAVFGPDGKIAGYVINANPEHLQLADTSGRVTSSTYGKTVLDPELAKYAVSVGGDNIFVSAADANKFWYKSYGASSYNKEDSTFSKIAEGLVKSGLMTAVGMAAGQAFGFADLLNSTTKSIVDATGATGDVAKALTSGIKSAATSIPKTILTGGDLSDVLQNAVTGGLTSGASSLVGNTVSGLINGVPTGMYDDQYTSVDTASGNSSFPLGTTISGGAAGATGGLINAAINGGDLATGALTGAAAGAAGGATVDAGIGGAAPIAGQIAGGLVNQALQPDPVAPPAATGTTQPPATTPVGTGNYALDWGDGPSFATLLPQTSRPEWGTRLINGRPA